MLMKQSGSVRHVEVLARVPAASVEIVHYNFEDETEGELGGEGDFLFNLCLMPRSRSRASYSQWNFKRSERLGSVFLVPAGHNVRIKAERGRQMSVVCRLHAAALHEHVSLDFGWSDHQLADALNIRSPRVRAILIQLAQEIRKPGFAGEMMIDLLARQLAIEVVRVHREGIETRAVGGLSPWRLNRIDRRLEDEINPPSLVELADLCGLSTRQLTRGFRASRGHSLGDHIAAIRTARARRMLAGSQSIKEIAYASGFRSPSSFSCAFRRATGETPRDFQSRISRQMETDDDGGLIETL